MMRPFSTGGVEVNNLGGGREDKRGGGLGASLRAARGFEEQVRPPQLLPPQRKHQTDGLSNGEADRNGKVVEGWGFTSDRMRSMSFLCLNQSRHLCIAGL